MNNQPIVFGIVGIFLGAFIVWGITTNAVNNQNLGMMGMMGIRNQSQPGYNNISVSPMMGNIDRHFIEQMIPHHEDAITMGKLALEKSQRSEIKTLAQNIIDSQSKEIDQMKSWYKLWFGTQVPEQTIITGMGMHGGMMGDQTDIKRLEIASDFDKTFIEEMIPHHQMAVMMASMLKSSTQRPEMKQLADDIIAAQTSEINQMRDWYKSWAF